MWERLERSSGEEAGVSGQPAGEEVHARGILYWVQGIGDRSVVVERLLWLLTKNSSRALRKQEFAMKERM